MARITVDDDTLKWATWVAKGRGITVQKLMRELMDFEYRYGNHGFNCETNTRIMRTNRIRAQKAKAVKEAKTKQEKTTANFFKVILEALADTNNTTNNKPSNTPPNTSYYNDYQMKEQQPNGY